MKHFMPSMLKAVTMAVGIRNYNVFGSLSRSNYLNLKMKLKSKLSILNLSLKSFLWERTIPMVVTQ